MKKMDKMDKMEILQGMDRINKSWTLKGKFIYRKFIFKDFIEAFSFMTSVAIIAEKSNHHPNWENVYNKVNIALNTHELDGITEKDFKLAMAIDDLI